MVALVFPFVACERAGPSIDWANPEQRVVGRMGVVECVRKQGRVGCRGSNERGLLGNGALENSSKDWTTIRLPKSVSEIALAPNDAFACGLTAQGELWCWGLNVASVLGEVPPLFDGEDVARSVTSPQQFQGVQGIAEMDVTVARVCVRSHEGGVYCWGQNAYGEIKDPRVDPRFVVPEPQKTALPTRARELHAFSAQTCAVLVNDELYCWGGSVPSAQGPIPAFAPTKVASGVTGVSISKDEVACAVTARGNVCWPILDASVRGRFQEPHVRREPGP
ncbi:MAG TPA: hypothetical protein VM261_32065 [Kofleriaceae bacterium]|nr:hypothetical protein [Kofleriaceae bacterium]